MIDAKAILLKVFQLHTDSDKWVGSSFESIIKNIQHPGW